MNLATVYMWIEKKLPTHKVGRLWKFKASQVEEWVQAWQGSRGNKEEMADGRTFTKTREAVVGGGS